MSTPDLSRVSIASFVLECVPESIAREACILPVRVDDTSITLFCPDEPDFRANHEARLRFVLDRSIVWIPVAREQLQAAIDYNFADLAEIVNCSPVFRYRCPRLWRDLTPTATNEVRVCEVCNQHVFRCETSEMAAQLGKEGKCVAFLSESGADLLGDVEVD